MSNGPIQFPSLRNWLIAIHKDLFRIERFLVYSYDESKLTQFEKLVLVLEDRRFLQHSGVDLIAAFRELAKAFTFRKHGGASTIDMQFVRTVTGYKDLKFKRKLYEAFLAYLVRFRYSKIQILRSYLECAYFGSHLIGAEKAAERMFEKSIAELNDEECAQIAAMLVYPRPLNPPDRWLPKILKRAKYGQRRLVRFKKCFSKMPS